MNERARKGSRWGRIGLIWAVCVCALALMPDGGLGSAGALAASATANTGTVSQNIKDKEDQISQIQQERNSLKNGLSDLQKMRDELATARADLKKYITRLDQDLSQIEQNIADLKAKIKDKEEDIVQAEAELARTEKIEKEQKEMMVRHIRLLYEQGSANTVEALLKTVSFYNLLNRLDYIEQMASYEKNLLEEYRENVAYAALCKEQLELERAMLEDTKAAVELEQGNLEKLIEQKNQDITSYDNDIANKEEKIKEYEDMIAQRDAEIKNLEAIVAEERRKALENNKEVLHYDNGVFKFPLASYTRISDDYGMRMHPTLGVEQFHSGVDFAAPKGTAIYAAYDGEVAAAAYSSSMGNYVMIDHGDSLYTIYMHASALYVEKGDVVARGDTIAAVGSTGRSTGNHLHFGVRLNGEYTSPWNYLSQ